MKKLVLIISALIFVVGVTMAHPIVNDTKDASQMVGITIPSLALADVGQTVKLVLLTSLLMLAGTKQKQE
jgi:hypothetical protein